MSEMREVLMHYFNVGTEETPKWVLLGDGITSLTESFNPVSETKQYVNQANGVTHVKSYTPSITVEKEYLKEDELQKWINEKIKLLPTGSAAVSEYVRVNIAEEPKSAGVYPAVKMKCSFQFDSIGGDAGTELINAMTLGGMGTGIVGTFNVKTPAFEVPVVESINA